MSGFADSQLMDVLVRMVVPMRREFGRQLDVRQFLHDVVYAQDVVTQALGSKDARLLEYARYVEQRRFGPRDVAPPTPGPAAKAAEPAAPAKAAKPASPTADELRERVMKKYTGGLR